MLVLKHGMATVADLGVWSDEPCPDVHVVIEPGYTREARMSKKKSPGCRLFAWISK